MRSPKMYGALHSGQIEGGSKSQEVEKYIRSFEAPAKSLINQLEQNINAGIYSHILGIDASGRIPALIIGEYIAEKSKEAGAVPERIFAAPNYTENSSPQLANLFKQADSIVRNGKRVLVIDDTIYKGKSIMEATRKFREHSIPFDIGIFLAVNNDKEDIERWRDFLDADNIYIGDHTFYSDGILDGEEEVPIVKNKDLSGVVRVEGSSLVQKNIPDQEIFKQGREEIKKMVQDFLSREGS